MALVKVRHRRRASIASLIDVIFLLLLFFMLASTFSKFSEVDIRLQSNSATAQSQTSIEVVRLTVTATGFLWGAEALGSDDLRTKINEAKSRYGADWALVVSTDDGVTTQEFIDVLATLSQITDIPISVLEPT